MRRARSCVARRRRGGGTHGRARARREGRRSVGGLTPATQRPRAVVLSGTTRFWHASASPYCAPVESATCRQREDDDVCVVWRVRSAALRIILPGVTVVTTAARSRGAKARTASPRESKMTCGRSRRVNVAVTPVAAYVAFGPYVGGAHARLRGARTQRRTPFLFDSRGNSQAARRERKRRRIIATGRVREK